MNSDASSPKPHQQSPSVIRLVVITGDNVPSKKNYHFPLKNGGVGIDKQIKRRMKAIEDGIVSALYSQSPMTVSETDSECRKRLRTLLCGLLDDSLREVPEFSFGVIYVENGMEGVQIEIERLT